MSTTNSESPSSIIPKLKKKDSKSPSQKLTPKMKRDLEYFLKSLPVDEYSEEQTDSLDNIATRLEHQTGEWLKAFAILGFTHDGKALKLFHIPTCIDAAAVTNLITLCATEQQMIDAIITKQNVSNFFNPQDTDYD